MRPARWRLPSRPQFRPIAGSPASGLPSQWCSLGSCTFLSIRDVSSRDVLGARHDLRYPAVGAADLDLARSEGGPKAEALRSGLLRTQIRGPLGDGAVRARTRPTCTCTGGPLTAAGVGKVRHPVCPHAG